MLNRRSFFLATAAAVGVPSLGAQLAAAPDKQTALGVDLARVTDAQGLAAIETFVNCVERHDADQLSGLRLCACERGEETLGCASFGLHLLGMLKADDLRLFFSMVDQNDDVETSMPYFEPFGDGALHYNGAWLTFYPGSQDQEPELTVHIASHICGRVAGKLALRYLACLRARLDQTVEGAR